MIRCKLIEQVQADAIDAHGRIDRAVTGEVLGLGRAASCKIYLPDPRVRLEHAVIRRAEDGYLYLDAVGPVTVDGRAQTNARLAVGQTIAIGPYDFILQTLQDGSSEAVAQITLAYALRDATASDEASGARVPAGPRDSWITRRRVAWVLALAVAMLCAVLPIWHAYQPAQAAGPGAVSAALAAPGAGATVARAPAAGASAAGAGRSTAPEGLWHSARTLSLQTVDWVLTRSTRLDTFWNPGPISSAHQSIADDCRACHARPFERVADASCTQCHKNVGTHVSDPRTDRMVFQEQRCATCHKDHQGITGMRTVDAIGCVQCHADVRRHAPTTGLANISDFARDHPAFRLSVRTAAAGAQMERVVQTPTLQSDPGYSFPHDLHLAKAGIKSPDGPPATGGRVVLECASCHTLDAASVRYEPVRMDRHCQSCHRLSVDPQAPDRQVQHGKPEVVRTAIREIFASLAVDRYPVSLVTVNTLLQRPGADAPPARTLGATQWVREQTERVMVSMFERPSGECRTCHAVQRAAPVKGAPPDWTVAPVASSSHWLPHSTFSHAQHQNAACSTCHAADQSRSAADILLPDIKACQSCHTGARAEPDKVASRCESCHGFHGKPIHPSFGKSTTAATKKP